MNQRYSNYAVNFYTSNYGKIIKKKYKFGEF